MDPPFPPFFPFFFRRHFPFPSRLSPSLSPLQSEREEKVEARARIETERGHKKVNRFVTAMITAPFLPIDRSRHAASHTLGAGCFLRSVGRAERSQLLLRCAVGDKKWLCHKSCARRSKRSLYYSTAGDAEYANRIVCVDGKTIWLWFSCLLLLDSDERVETPIERRSLAPLQAP